MTHGARPVLLAFAVAATATSGVERVIAQDPTPNAAFALTATAHPPVPGDASAIWLAPSASPTRPSALARGVAELAEGRTEAALPLLSQAPPDAALAAHQQYYRALALTRLDRRDEALRAWKALLASPPAGYLSEAAILRSAELDVAMGDAAAAVRAYEALSKQKTAAPDDVLMRLAHARLAAGDRRGAAETFARVHYEHPLSDLAAIAASQVDAIGSWEPLASTPTRVKLELGRAERLFGARRYAQARDAFEALVPHVDGDEGELVSLRLAEADHYLKRYRAARTALEPWTREARRRAEARFFYLTATRELGEHAEYLRAVEALVAEFPQESWSEEALNNLATHYILTDDDDAADRTFRRLAQLFPEGRHAARAAWKIGWKAYREGRHSECADVFEEAAAAFPRSDYRPSWIYWAARSRDQLGDTRLAHRLYGILVADYMNSYYGRLASRTLTSRKVEPLTMAAAVAPPEAARADARAAVSTAPREVATANLIRTLIAHQLYADALNEVQWAQRTFGDSPVLQATAGLIYSRQGDMRRGINAVKRAYPQYLAAGGEELPSELLEVLFPVAYWRLIQKHAPARGLDPYMIAALMAQESTFTADIRSSANAIGLMQIVPATGRRYARRMGIGRFSAAKLTDPEVNVRIGTAYFADLVERFGGVHLALASYNAGPTAVARWMAERPGVARDEFIDDIPYPETQNYVKKILGTADDYRRLYDGGGARPLLGPPGSEVADSVAPARRATPAAKAPAKKKAPVRKRAPRRR